MLKFYEQNIDQISTTNIREDSNVAYGLRSAMHSLSLN